MKKFIKSNILIIISILLLIIWFLFGLNDFMKLYNSEKKTVESVYEKCQSGQLEQDHCINIEKNMESMKIPPAPLLFIYILVGGRTAVESVTITAIMFVSIPAIWYFYKDTKNGIFKYKLTRQKYKEYFLSHYKKSLKCILIIPIFMLIAFFITCCVSKFKLQYQPGELELGGQFLEY